MINTPFNYLNALYLIQNGNRETKIIEPLPPEEELYKVNLNTRIVEAPSHIGLEKDHRAETYYFIVDRYYDLVDLAQDSISIMFFYEAADGKGYAFAPSYIDITSYKDKIVFPWIIEYPATIKQGAVKFSIQFFRLNSRGEYDYLLTTLPSQTKVLNSIVEKIEESADMKIDSGEVHRLQAQIDELRRTDDIYWIIMDELPEQED